MSKSIKQLEQDYKASIAYARIARDAAYTATIAVDALAAIAVEALAAVRTTYNLWQDALEKEHVKEQPNPTPVGPCAKSAKEAYERAAKAYAAEAEAEAEADY